MSVAVFLSRWELLNPIERKEVFESIYRTLPDKYPWLETAKETALNLNEREADIFNTWWRHYRKTGETTLE